jgi:hypothetical protein
MPLTPTDFDNGKLDLDHIAAIANSPAPTATDRLGNTKSTIAGAVAAIDAKVANVESARAGAVSDMASDVNAVEAAKATAINTTIPAKVAQIDAAVAATYVGQAQTARNQAESARDEARTARDAAQAAVSIYATTAKALSKGVAGYATLVGGAGGTNGTFDIAFSGGGGSGAAGRFTVAGGSLVSIQITASGADYATPPAMSFAASAGLAGASATAVIANNVDPDEYFYTPAADNTESLILWKNNAGAAQEIKRFYSRAALDQFYDGTYDRPDRIWSWHDSDRNEVAHINEKAELNDHHTNISLEVGGLREIVCFGDSLTQGNGWDAADSMPMILQGLTGWRTYNRGVSAFSALRIATTQGGVVSLMSFPNNTIPAAGAVEVSAYTNPIRGDIGVRTISGYLLYGGLKIPGVIQHTGIYPAGNPRQGQDIYTFTRTTAGDAIEVDPKTPFIVDQNGDDYRIQVWWSGRNGYGADPTGATLISYYKRMRDILKPARERFVILGIINGWGWNEFPGGVPIPSGGGELGYNQILTINNNVKQEFPDNFIDVQKRLVRSVKNSVDPLDIEDYNRDVVPRSLAPDGLHLNMPGKTIVAQSAYDFFLMKGWLE